MYFNPDIIHLHGYWMAPQYFGSKTAKNFQIPSILSPHGMLDKWALNQSSIKKKLSWHIWEKKALDNCSFIHALSDSELNSIKKINSSWKTYKITNGIKLPNKKGLSLKTIPRRWNERIPKDAKILLFMERMFFT